MLYAIVITVLALVQVGPATPPADGLDTLIEKVAKLRDQQKDLKAQEDKLLADIRTRYKDLADKIDKLLGAAPTPPPADKLAADLAALYAAEPSATKKLQALTLAALYKQAAKEANSPTCENCADLAALILSFIENAEGLGPDAMKSIRGRVQAELKSVAPSLEAPLNDGLRAAINSIYSRAAAAIEGVAK